MSAVVAAMSAVEEGCFSPDMTLASLLKDGLPGGYAVNDLHVMKEKLGDTITVLMSGKVWPIWGTAGTTAERLAEDLQVSSASMSCNQVTNSVVGSGVVQKPRLQRVDGTLIYDMICRDAGCEPPIICTPDELMGTEDGS